jgi:AraC-like DNA-binding protein
MGTNWPHDPDHIQERQDGFEEYLFLRFRTRIVIRTARGIEKGPAGACLVYAPWHPQWYRGDGIAFRDDWLHVSGSDVSLLLTEAQVPLNTLLLPTATRFFPQLIEEMLREKHRQEPYSEQVIGSLVAQLVFLLGRTLSERTLPPGQHSARRDILRRVRQQVLGNLSEAWSVARMADLAGLGENRFAVLYRRCFDVSPMEDLIQARIRRAQWLLSNLHTPVGAAAEACGFSDVHYFSRLFRRRVGCPPSQYASRHPVHPPSGQ